MGYVDHSRLKNVFLEAGAQQDDPIVLKRWRELAKTENPWPQLVKQDLP